MKQVLENVEDIVRMERASYSFHKRQTSWETYHGNVSKAKAFSDEYGASRFPPGVEEYTDIFGSFRISRASSIPSLDLPAADKSVVSLDVLGSQFDYSEVFRGCNGLGFAISFEELLKRANEKDESSDDAWTPAESEYLSDESELSAYDALDEITSDEEYDISYSDVKKYDYSYQKENQKSDIFVHNGTEHLGHVCTLSAFPFSENERNYLQKSKETKLFGKVSDVTHKNPPSFLQSPLEHPMWNLKEEICSIMPSLGDSPSQADAQLVVNSFSSGSVDSIQYVRIKGQGESLSGNMLEEKKGVIEAVEVMILEEDMSRSAVGSCAKGVQEGKGFLVSNNQSHLDKINMFNGKKNEKKLRSPKKAHGTEGGKWKKTEEFYEFITSDISEKCSQPVISNNIATERICSSEHITHVGNTALQELGQQETDSNAISSISEINDNTATYNESKCQQDEEVFTQSECGKDVEATTQEIVDVNRSMGPNIAREEGQDAFVRIQKGGGIIGDLGKRLRETLIWAKNEETCNGGYVNTDFEATKGGNIKDTKEMKQTPSKKANYNEVSEVEQERRARSIEFSLCMESEKKLMGFFVPVETTKNNSKIHDQLREVTETQNEKSFKNTPCFVEATYVEHVNKPEGEDDVQEETNGSQSIYRAWKCMDAYRSKLTYESGAYLDSSDFTRPGVENGVLDGGSMVRDKADKLKADGKSEAMLVAVENHFVDVIKSCPLEQGGNEAGGWDNGIAETILDSNFDNMGKKHSYDLCQTLLDREKNKHSTSNQQLETDTGTRIAGSNIIQEKDKIEKMPQSKNSSQNTEGRVKNGTNLPDEQKNEWNRSERQLDMDKIDEGRERERERQKDRMAVEIRTSKVCERVAFDAWGMDRAAGESWKKGVEGEPAERLKARLERQRRTAERAAKALAEKDMRDRLAQREWTERIRVADILDADVKQWASGKEGNLRALLSTLQYILGPESGWQAVPLTEVITAPALKKAYRKATLCLHPDKLQQRRAGVRQKYICEKVFDLLKEAWTKFNSQET